MEQPPLSLSRLFLPSFPICASSCYYIIPQIQPQQHKHAINPEKLALIVTVFPTS